jgi:hypothetical protein
MVARIKDIHLAHLYKVSDVVSGKFYIGKHGGTQQENYWGSGLRIQRHIKKHGKANMKYEILAIGTQQYIFNLEKAYVDDAFIKANPNCLNLAKGGMGGNLGLVPHNKGKITSEAVRLKQSLAKIGKPSPRKGVKLSTEIIQKMVKNHPRTPLSEAGKQAIIKANTGRKHQKVNCPHCNTTGGITGMARWHFDNCKLRTIA